MVQIVEIFDWFGRTFPDWVNSLFFTGCYMTVIIPYVAWMPKGSLSDEPLD